MNKLQRKFSILNFPNERDIFLFWALLWWICIENIFPFSNQLTSNQLATNHHPDIGGIWKKENFCNMNVICFHFSSFSFWKIHLCCTYIYIRTLCCMLSDDAHHFSFKWRVIFYSVTAAVAPHTISLLYCPQHIHIWCQSIFRLTINISESERWPQKDILMNARGENFS